MPELRYIRNASTNYLPALVEPVHSSRREQVRWRVRHLNLSALDRQTRRDASADPGIEWDPAERQYRIRRRAKSGEGRASPVQSAPSAISAASPPASPPATLDSVEMGGSLKSSEAKPLPTGGCPECEIKHAKTQQIGAEHD